MVNDELRIMRANESDIEAIFALYRSLIHMPYSTWSEEYPALEDVVADVRDHAVLVMVWAAVSTAL